MSSLRALAALAFVLAALLFISLNSGTWLVVRRTAGDGAALIVALFLTFKQDRLDGLTVREALTLGGLVTVCHVMRTAGQYVCHVP